MPLDRTIGGRPGLYLASILVLAGLAAATAVLDPAAFTPYLGSLHPALGIALVGALGLLCLAGLDRLRSVWAAPPLAGTHSFIVMAIAASALAALTITMDVVLGFPRDINVPWPQAWLFYPAVGLVAEVVFHLVPLLLLAALISRIPTLAGTRLGAVLCLAGAAAAEPAFQVALSVGRSGGMTLLDVYVAAAVFAFGLLQLAAFQRFGFAAMYALRLVYYLWWHILWGAWRLDLLF